MITCPDAVINPRTVVVKPLNAAIADVAVAAAFGSYDLTLRTQMIRIECLNSLEKGNLLILSEIPRIPQPANKEENRREGEKNMGEGEQMGVEPDV